jgi:hypothetical protein
MRALLISLTVIGVTLGVFLALNLNDQETNEGIGEGAIPTPS